jgi:tetratricopeptide (TPR) repeat protein
MGQGKEIRSGARKAGQARNVIAECVALAVLVVLCALIYSNTLQNGFQLDDFYRIIGNPGVMKIQPIWRHFEDASTISNNTSLETYRPLLPLTLSLNYAISGFKPASYHVFNITVHAIAVVFWYLLFLTLLRKWDNGYLANISSRGIAFGAAAIFAVHPVSGFPVNYLCARDLLMMEAFLAGSLYSYVRMREQGETALRWGVTLALLFGSLLSKTNAVMAPFLIFLFEFIIAGEKIRSKQLWLRVCIFAAAVAIFLEWTKFYVHCFPTENILIYGGKNFVYLMTQVKLHLFHYIRNFLWPFKIRAMPYVQPVESLSNPKMLIALFFILATLIVGWLIRKRAPIVAFSIFAYWVMMALESSFLPLLRLSADYRLYSALPFLTLILSILIFKYLSRQVSLILTAILLVYLGISSYFMNQHFKDERSFWAQSVRYRADEVGNLNYGLTFRGIDDATAKKFFEKSIEIDPSYYLAYIDLGLCDIDMGDKGKGLELAKKGVSLSPRTAMDQSLFWLAVAYRRVGDLKSAYRALVQSFEFNPNNPRHLYEGAVVAQSLGKREDALSCLNRIHLLVPNYKLSRFKAGSIYQAAGQNDKAIEEYRLAIKYNPQFSPTYENLGYALMSLGRREEACKYFETFLKFHPENQEAKLALAECLKARKH